MAESLISDIYNTVRNKLRDEGTLLLGVPEEASKMKNTLESIEAVLASAEKKEVTDDAVKLWLRDLKDVAYDIEDVLEDWSIAQLQMQDESAGTSQQQGLNPKGKLCICQLCIGDVVLPRTLNYIEVDTVGGECCIFKEKRNGVDQPEDSEVMVQQQQLLKFNYVSIHKYKKIHELVRRSVVALTRVKEIYLIYVHDEFLPPLGLMPFLEKLYVSEARQVKKVGDEFLGISNNKNNNYRGLGKGNYDEHKGGDRGRAFIAFPRLKKLYLSDFDRWEEWEDPQVEGADDQINIMPFLCELKIDVSILRSLPRFLEGVPLQMLCISKRRDEMPRIRHIEDKACKTSTILAQNLEKMELIGIINAWVRDWRNYCVNLKVLTLHICRNPSLLELGALPSLEVLRADIVTLGGGGTPTRRQSQQSSSSSCNTSTVFFPSLRILYISAVSVKGWEDLLGESDWISGDIRYGTNHAITIMPCLRELSITCCAGIKALPNFLQKVPLRRLSITNCDTLETWWENEAGEDWLSWKSNISQVVIKKRNTGSTSGSSQRRLRKHQIRKLQRTRMPEISSSGRTIPLPCSPPMSCSRTASLCHSREERL